MKSERNQVSETGQPLEKGQVWNLKDKCLEIQRVGKYLVEFLITQKDHKAPSQERIRIGKHLESIQAVQRFLQSHKAILANR